VDDNQVQGLEELGVNIRPLYWSEGKKNLTSETWIAAANK